MKFGAPKQLATENENTINEGDPKDGTPLHVFTYPFYHWLTLKPTCLGGLQGIQQKAINQKPERVSSYLRYQSLTREKAQIGGHIHSEELNKYLFLSTKITKELHLSSKGCVPGLSVFAYTNGNTETHLY